MSLDKKTIVYLVATIVCFSLFSGCLLNDIFGTSFSLNSWNLVDNDGFPGLSLVFSSSGTITVKTLDPYENVIDSELFLQGNNDAFLHLASYRETIASGQYTLKAYDKNDNEISEKTFSFEESNLTISSCDQKWWKQYAFKEDYSLLGLTMLVTNNGATPLYPYTVEVTMDSETVSGYVLPCTVSAGESEYIECFVYKEENPLDDVFSVVLKDSNGDILGDGSFSIVLNDDVDTKEFKWTYKGRNRILSIPYPDFLFAYYIDIERILHEDYGVYVFDMFDDDYLDLVADRLMSSYYVSKDIDRVNFAASFVQNLDYKFDSETNDSLEYPRYPVETLFNGDGGGDCEDLSILAASILDKLGYDVALFRLPKHMAVGVSLDEELSGYDYYTDEYYFLETTAVVPSCGYIPDESKYPSELTVYHISSRVLPLHYWENGSITIYRQTELGDFVKVNLFVENHGSTTADSVTVKAGFYSDYGAELNVETTVVTDLEPGSIKKASLIAVIPTFLTTTFKTRVYFDYKIIDEKETASTFP
jgi:hypothetical protein